MKQYQIVEETLGYVTSESQTNTDPRNLVAGSRNVLVDQQRKVQTRNGNTRLGAANAATTGVRGGVTWNTSTGLEFATRGYDDELEVWLATVDGTELNAFYRIANGFSTTAKPRFTTWYDATEGIDLLIFVWGDDNTYEWGGGVAVVDSITGTTITKVGTDTFAQSRFYTTRNKIVVNVRTGTEYTYTGGETSTTLTGIADTTGIVAGDVLVQKIVTQANSPAADRNNHTVWTFENQLCVASDDDEQVYVSKNTSYYDYTFSSPRTAGQGVLFTLDDAAHAFGELEGSLIIFAGKNSIYQGSPQEITVGTTLAETFAVKKYQVGEGQSARNQEVIGHANNTIIYLSFEPAVRELPSLASLQGGARPQTLSNPIKPDMDAETWTNACARWYKNAYYLSAPTNGRVYILEYREDADGKLRRFWQAPQTMFIGAFVTIDNLLYGHSSAVPETYRLFDPEAYSDVNSTDDKMAIKCVAKFAYRNYGSRSALKNFDEYFVEGEISPSTELLNTLYYNYGGNAQSIENIIDGADYNILEETLENVSLGQQPLGQVPLGGAVNAPEGAAKFRAFIEIAKEDFFEMQEIFETDDTDKFWSIIARGPNAKLSTRQPVNRKI
jgi:hypothetical protein